jgi:methylthioribulose-1-phosphate dehydratase
LRNSLECFYNAKLDRNQVITMSPTQFWQNEILELQAVVIEIADRGWCPATGGNFSVRLESNLCAITASGVNKAQLKVTDFLLVELSGKTASDSRKPSAETLLHTTLYSLDSAIRAVLHIHTVPSTVLSNYFIDRDALIISGYEMQKALTGVTTHESSVRLPIIDNHQDMNYLSAVLKQRWGQEQFDRGFILRGHGLYVWGNNLQEAKRHLEAIEFLLDCQLNQLLLLRK